MNDERVDELLKDLDAALSVQPSPSVTARVRTRIDRQSGRRAGAWQLATVAAVAIAAVAYGVSRRMEPAATGEARKALSTPASPSRATGSAPSGQPRDSASLRPPFPAPAARAQTRAGVTEPARAAEPREPAVIVSPQVRLAFEQLQAAARSGRLTAESFSQPQPMFEPRVMTPTAIEILPLEIDIVPLNRPATEPGPDGRGQSDQEPGPIWPNRPLSRTRSTS